MSNLNFDDVHTPSPVVARDDVDISPITPIRSRRSIRSRRRRVDSYTPASNSDSLETPSPVIKTNSSSLFGFGQELSSPTSIGDDVLLRFSENLVDSFSIQKDVEEDSLNSDLSYLQQVLTEMDEKSWMYKHPSYMIGNKLIL
ncbi:hypothetical protein AKO1_005882 [Acrasis kona]|uniref:Uncharacterized protein n=1 Tax=Acrasis kona TaxID=1008807 RepID=A0AAW2YJL9_9EUKA